MKKLAFGVNKSFILFTMFFLLILPFSLLMAEWSCDHITVTYNSCVSCHNGAEMVTATINFQNIPNDVEFADFYIEYDPQALEYRAFDAEGCLPETYDHWYEIWDDVGTGLLYAFTMAGNTNLIPAGSTGCVFNIIFKNLITPDVPQICILDTGYDIEEWCDILPICCHIQIDPETKNVVSGETAQFSAISPYCEVHQGNYTWSIDPSSQHGSSIDSNGLYTAGCVVNTYEVEEIIKATDVANGNIESSVVVNLHGCGIFSITYGGGATIFNSGEIRHLAANTSNCPNELDLHWSIEPPSEIGSAIDHNGLYRVGINLNSENVTETIKMREMNNCCGEECATSEKQFQIKPCTINLSPTNTTIGAGGTIQFNLLSNNCCPDTPIYTWELSGVHGTGSTIGSNIDYTTGLYTAGRNFPDPPTSCDEVLETIIVTDECSGKTATTNATVKACKVTIIPESETVEQGETIQFSATVDECCINPPSYTWSVSSMGYTSGGTIDNHGLYTAGPNTGTDIIAVTDTAHYYAAHKAMVTVEAKYTTTTTISRTSTTTTIPNPLTTSTVITTTIIPTPCEVAITPPGKTLSFGGEVQFSATTECDGEEGSPDSYTWNVSGSAGGVIDGSGLYTAGDKKGTDIVRASDKVNNAEGTATVVVESGKAIMVSPSEVQRSRWIPLLRLMSIEGTETNFEIFKTPVDYDSPSLFQLPALVLSPTDIYQVILVMPSLLTGIGFDGESETVTVMVDGVSDTFEIKMLPAPFDEKKNLK